MELPELTTSKHGGRIHRWHGRVESIEDTWNIVIEYGVQCGKQQTTKIPIKKGKNIGRSNETSPFEQACSELKSKYDKKLHQGYHPEIDSLMTSLNISPHEVVDEETVILPMLAKKFEERLVSEVAFVQPKLDGIRAIFIAGRGELVSRTGHVVQHCGAIVAELQNKDTKWNLDGELYCPGVPFNEFTGIFRKKLLNDQDMANLRKVKYFVFDIVTDGCFSDRLTILNSIPEMTLIDTVKTERLQTLEELYDRHNQFLHDGYEGVIVRNAKGLYTKNKRSSDLLKLKKFQDEEYKIVGFTSGKGREQDAIIFICETGGRSNSSSSRSNTGSITGSITGSNTGSITGSNTGSSTFKVRPQGSIQSRQQDFLVGETFVGRCLTVKYFEKIKNIPRFPIGLAIRDYE